MHKISMIALAAAVALGLASLASAQTMTTPSTGMEGATHTYGATGASHMSGQVDSSTAVKSTLEASGYSDVHAIKKAPTGWTATAVKNGHRVRVAVDDQGNIAIR
jgi:hypothetical protein